MGTQYEEFRHPNAMTENGTVPVFTPSRQEEFDKLPPRKKGCAYYFGKFDGTILRPIFVYKYSERKHMPDIPFEALLEEGDNHF